MYLSSPNVSDSESSENLHRAGHISPQTQMMYERIADFAENDVFVQFRDFNFATLELFKMLDVPTFNIINWTKDNYRNWTSAYRSYCAKYWDTYVGREMCTGDLLDWWDTHQKDLVNIMNFVLVGNHPDPIGMLTKEVN